jgi:hypothetical protein
MIARMMAISHWRATQSITTGSIHSEPPKDFYLPSEQFSGVEWRSCTHRNCETTHSSSQQRQSKRPAEHWWWWTEPSRWWRHGRKGPRCAGNRDMPPISGRSGGWWPSKSPILDATRWRWFTLHHTVKIVWEQSLPLGALLITFKVVGHRKDNLDINSAAWLLSQTI